MPKKAYLRKHVGLAKYGFAAECPGCESTQMTSCNKKARRNALRSDKKERKGGEEKTAEGRTEGTTKLKETGSKVKYKQKRTRS